MEVKCYKLCWGGGMGEMGHIPYSFSLPSFLSFLFTFFRWISFFLSLYVFCLHFKLIFSSYFSLWRDNAAGITTRLLYRFRVLAGARNFSVLRNVQIESPVQLVRGALSVEIKWFCFHQVSSLRLSGVIPPFLYACETWRTTALPVLT